MTKPTPDDLVLFYFAGHGLPIIHPDSKTGAESRSEVFLVSYDFDRQKIEQARGAWSKYPLRMGHIRSAFFEGEDGTLSKKVLFLFDSCHSGDFYGRPYRGNETLANYIEEAFTGMSAGRIVLSSCMPQQKAREDVGLQHGVFTYYLLEALAGQAPEAIEPDGWVTVGSLFSYLSRKLPEWQRPVRSGVEHGAFQLFHYPEFTKHYPTQTSLINEDEQKHLEREHRLKALLIDHSGFMSNRLSNFVGRVKELTEIHQRITAMLPTGGYITITGQAGQGKSCIIAKLVEEYNLEKPAYHFIPFNPGPDYQVSLLRDLMARLILKNDLFDLYAASENRAALRDYFPKVLAEIVAKGGQEVIFIDGLDQLKEDMDGERDLRFLPNNPPSGIVFVLGTRPNDTLRPLELLKPHNAYPLPNLSRQDFDLLLEHRKVKLDRVLADQFYQAMQENALYLDLVAQELAQEGTATPEDIIKRVTDNPNNIFSLSLARLKRQGVEWRNILKPVLGVLLVAREPLARRHIRQILEVDDERLGEGLARLGGLVADDGRQRYSLFHLKLLDYLRQDESKPHEEYIFAKDEEEGWHKKLVDWCESGGATIIWKDMKRDPTEQGRREYAREHYITHLYYALEWQRLFDVLDEGVYGRAKVHYDPSTSIPCEMAQAA